MDLDGVVPLPLGTKLARHTVAANPIVELQVDDINVVEETDSGWPTIITAEIDGQPVGVAIDYLGTWHDIGMEEVDIVLAYEDGNYRWMAVVAFSTKADAIESGRYEIEDYDGFELIPWNTEDRYQRTKELRDDGITPIAYDEESPRYPAHAIQEANEIDTLLEMFGLDKLKTLEERRTRLFNRIIPRDERWEETPLQELAKDIVED
jgi:hypothetical protein